MANTSSAKKAYRQSVVRAERNKHHRTMYRTSIKKVLTAIATGNHKESMACLCSAQSLMFKAVKHNLITKNAASRKLHRLNNKIKSLISGVAS